MAMIMFHELTERATEESICPAGARGVRVTKATFRKLRGDAEFKENAPGRSASGLEMKTPSCLPPLESILSRGLASDKPISVTPDRSIDFDADAI